MLNGFDELAEQSVSGKPFVHKSRRTVSLLFDVSAIQSEMHLDYPDHLTLAYTKAMMGFLLFNSEPQLIAMIGLGGGSLTKYCYNHLPLASIVVVDNDPRVIALRDSFCIPEDDARLQVLCQDGVEMVAQADAAYDVLIVDGFDRHGQPPPLCSQTFYDACFQSMKEDGILVVNLLGEKQDMELYVDRIRRSFDEAVLAIDVPDSNNKIVFACKGTLLDIPDQQIIDRLRLLEPQHDVALRLTAQNLLQQRRNNWQPVD
ncbi:transferase [Undibacterium terreum]|uniref:Spermidine synthase n=1 Tax=Undibacterium terreum TaxID=1224302 RepID=A0A916UDC7_9BURK|nr:transferase [Undibacterium terreum]GGC68103.1 spermidine synthase [Undibacterium terreum]